MITELFFSAIVMIIWKPGLKTSECSSENENAAHAECHCLGDIAVRMREVLANVHPRTRKIAQGPEELFMTLIVDCS